MKKIQYYGFLDVVVDIFYSIILYNAFLAFPGFNGDFLLMIFGIFVMLNYWWIARNYQELPKYYLFDFYALVIIMFVFSRWSEYFTDIHNFIGILALFFALDSLYSFLSISLHSEKKDEKSLIYYTWSEGLLAIIYGLLFLSIREKTFVNIIIITLPYLVFYYLTIKNGLFKTKFIDNGKQPY